MPSLMLGISLANAGQNAIFDPSAVALFARFTTPPTALRAQQISTLIASLRAAGVWAKMDAFYMMAAADAQAAQRNWVADAYNLTPVNSPTFTADRGYAGNGTNSYLNTGYTPSTAGGNMTLNSAHVSIRPRTGSPGSLFDIGARAVDNTGSVGISGSNGSSFMTFSVNSATSGAGPASASPAAHFVASRIAEGTMQGCRNGGTYTSVSNTSDALPAFPIFICTMNAGGALSGQSTRQMASASIGGGLSQGEATALYNAVNTYMVAVGA